VSDDRERLWPVIEAAVSLVDCDHEAYKHLCPCYACLERLKAAVIEAGLRPKQPPASDEPPIGRT